MIDLYIKNAMIYLGKGKLRNGNLAIKDGYFVENKNIDEKSIANIIDANGKVVCPTFLDTHMHIDKAFSYKDDETMSLIAALNNSIRHGVFDIGLSQDEIYNKIYLNSKKVIDLCVKHGTTYIKTNVLFTKYWGAMALEVMDQLKKEYKDKCTILSCVPFFDELSNEINEAYKSGKVDFVGGYGHLAVDHKLETDKAFELAKEYNLPLDLHCDESDTNNMDNFEYICEKTKEYGFSGLVTMGHVTALDSSVISEERVSELIEMAKDVDMNITSLTACNLYLMNKTRRGPTRLKQLREAGINVSIASDNIRDTFRPFGNCNLIEELLLTNKIHKYVLDKDIDASWDMITYNPAKNCNLKKYGMDVGCEASFNILDCTSLSEGLKDICNVEKAFKNGKIIEV